MLPGDSARLQQKTLVEEAPLRFCRGARATLSKR